MRLSDLAGMVVAVAGAGTDVTAALGPIRSSGPARLVCVTDDPDGAEGLGLPVLGTDPTDPEVAAVEVFVRSPGFGRYHPLLVAADDRGARVTTPLDLWMGEREASRPVACVTGTKGKSTTTTFAGRLAQLAGVTVSVAGNLGPPVFDPAWDHGGPAVLEVSSYQAADLCHPPDIAVVTSLAPDHLSWHGGWNRYVADKLRVVANPGGVAPVVLVAEAEVAAVAAVRALGPASVQEVPVPAGWTARWPAVPTHTYQNLALAARLVEVLCGVVPDVDHLGSVVEEGVEGRLEVVARVGSVTVVDDPLASNPTAAAAALRWLRDQAVGSPPPTVVLVGGEDRSVGAEPLAAEVRAWPDGRLRAVALPINGETMAAASGLDMLGAVDDVAAAATLAIEAVEDAGGGFVLFAPGAPTPGRATWKDRSAAVRVAAAQAFERAPDRPR